MGKVTLAQRVLAVMASPQPPTTVGALATRLEVPVDVELYRALERPPERGIFDFFRPKGKGSPPKSRLGAIPLHPRGALARTEVFAEILHYALSLAETPKTVAFTPVQLSGRLAQAAAKVLRAALEEALAARALPEGFGAISLKGHRYVFSVKNVLLGGASSSADEPAMGSSPEPSPDGGPRPIPPPGEAMGSTAGTQERPTVSDPTEAARFEREFSAAFDRLDAEGRGLNFVKLYDLRRALPRYDRATFDRELRRLRVEGRFQLNAAEGTHRQLSDEEREASLLEAGSRLAYVRRRR